MARGADLVCERQDDLHGRKLKDKIKLTFAKGAKLDDPQRLFNASLDGNLRRAIDLGENAGVDEAAFKALVRAGRRRMTKYLISFPSAAMKITDEELPAVSIDAHAVIEDAKAAGAYVFGGGINEGVDPVLVSGDGSTSTEMYPGSRLDGGFAVLELPTREAAVEWAAKIAVACRCAQELREFLYDPAS